jgi:glutamyl-tRNA reductase
VSQPELVVVGCSHMTAPPEVRESLAFTPEQVREALRLARGERILQETMILSTCNRTEFYSLSADPARAESYVRELVSRFKGPDLFGAGPYSYTYRERDAVRHLFRVAAGLDSMVLGEMQVLGQVKDAYELACEGGGAGLFLHRLLASAFRAGKRARTETGIGAGAVSFASAAVSLTTKIFSDLSDKRVLVIGAGEFGRLTAQHFASEKPAGLMISNRTPERAKALASELGGEEVPYDALFPSVVRADVVVCATRSPGPIITADLARRAMRERASRPLVCVDLAVPRDVDASVAQLDNVFVYALEVLRTIMEQNLSRRRRDVPRVEAIVEDEVEKFFLWARSLEVTPVVRELRERFEAIRQEELRRHMNQFREDQRGHVEALTRSLVNKLLHHPTTRIKGFDLESGDGLVRLDAVREIFDLRIKDAAGPITGFEIDGGRTGDGCPEGTPGEGGKD